MENIIKYRRLKEKFWLWYCSKIKNGIVYVDEKTTIADALKKVAKGGYIILK